MTSRQFNLEALLREMRNGIGGQKLRARQEIYIWMQTAPIAVVNQTINRIKDARLASLLLSVGVPAEAMETVYALRKRA